MTELEQTLQSKLSRITGLDAGAMEKARARQSELAKPPGSLGLLEDLSVQLAGITGQVTNELSKTRIYVLAADNGVVDEGVSSAPQTVIDLTCHFQCLYPVRKISQQKGCILSGLSIRMGKQVP